MGPVLRRGWGLDNDRTLLCDPRGNPLSTPAGKAHIHSLLVQNAEEIYEFRALVISAVSLFMLVLKDVLLPVVSQIASYLGSINQKV